MEYPIDKDFPQIIKAGFDDEIGRHKVDALISDGVDALIINPDGSINVHITPGPGPSPLTDVVETGKVETAYNENTSIATGILTQVISYTCIQPTRVKSCEVTGTNIAEYTVLVNGTVINKKRTYYGNLNSNFQFSKGLSLQMGDIVSVNVLHTQPSMGDFSAFILVLKDNTTQ